MGSAVEPRATCTPKNAKSRCSFSIAITAIRCRGVPATLIPVRDSTPRLNPEIEKRCEFPWQDYARRFTRLHAGTPI